MSLIGIDIGTTGCKVALFDERGALLRSATNPTPTDRDHEAATHDPDALWQTVVDLIRRVAADERPAAVGVAGMAEAGLLVDQVTGAPRSPVIAWFDTRATPQAEELAARESLEIQFRRSGLHPSYKYGLSKILWLRAQRPPVTRGAVWLSVPDYIVFRLTGEMATDPTLAARTYAFRILEGSWDEEWIGSLELDASLFPQVLPSGSPVGGVGSVAADETGLPAGIPVAVAGHDHLCSLLAAGIVEPGPILDSMGTAESVMAVAVEPRAGDVEMASGLALVPHVVPGVFCWLGGISAAGGSIEWLRRNLRGPFPLTDEQMEAEFAAAGSGPTKVLYFPYLLGSGAPQPDRRVRAAFVGLEMSDDYRSLIHAVLQGLAFEGKRLTRAVEQAAGTAASELVALGGGVRAGAWLSTKADVAGREYCVPDLPQPTALGAALLAGIGSGELRGVDEVVGLARERYEAGTIVRYDPPAHSRYKEIYERGYLPLQDPLRAYGLAAVSLRWIWE